MHLLESDLGRRNVIPDATKLTAGRIGQELSGLSRRLGCGPKTVNLTVVIRPNVYPM